MIDRILVPLDGSRLAECALPQALALQHAFASEVVLARIVGASSSASGEIRGHLDRRFAHAEARAYLTDLSKKCGVPEGACRVEVGTGRVADEILNLTRARSVDLLALSTHGEGGLTPFALSGTVQKVLFGAPCSVLVVRATEGCPSPSWQERRPAEHERILMALDGSPRSEWALSMAAALARATGAELVLGRVVPRPDAAPEDPACLRAAERLVEANRRAAGEALAALRTRLESSGLAIRSRIVVASGVARALRRIARDVGASLTVVAAHGASAHPEWPYGSVSISLLHHGSTPLLIFQDFPASPASMDTGGSARRRRRESRAFM